MKTLMVKTSKPEIKKDFKENPLKFRGIQFLKGVIIFTIFSKKLINEDGEEHQKVRTLDYLMLVLQLL